jgi:hypothetical protein
VLPLLKVTLISILENVILCKSFILVVIRFTHEGMVTILHGDKI